MFRRLTLVRFGRSTVWHLMDREGRVTACGRGPTLPEDTVGLPADQLFRFAHDLCKQCTKS